MEGKCGFGGCANKVHSRGLCAAHYQQQRAGKPLKQLQQQFHGLTELERFERRLAKQPTGCWKWLGSIKKMRDRPTKDWHGQWRNENGGIELTHRAAWRLFVGPIPSGACVLHRCDVPRCCNPDHLYLGTQADNVRDMWDRGRLNPGISRGEEHGNAKLTENLVIEIRESCESGPKIAARLGLSTTTIYDVRNQKIWVHVK